MEEQKIISGRSIKDAWEEVRSYLNSNPDLLEYRMIIGCGGQQVTLNIDIDLGGGFESGFEITRLYAAIEDDDFRFSLYHQTFIDEVGKFFGMEDVEIGYADFDKELIIKATDKDRVKALFLDSTVREVYQLLRDFTLEISSHTADDDLKRTSFLELQVERAIKDPDELCKIYDAFCAVLSSIRETSSGALAKG